MIKKFLILLTVLLGLSFRAQAFDVLTINDSGTLVNTNNTITLTNNAVFSGTLTASGAHITAIPTINVTGFSNSVTAIITNPATTLNYYGSYNHNGAQEIFNGTAGFTAVPKFYAGLNVYSSIIGPLQASITTNGVFTGTIAASGVTGLGNAARADTNVIQATSSNLAVNAVLAGSYTYQGANIYNGLLTISNANISSGTINASLSGNGAGLTNFSLFPEADAFWTNGTVQTPFTKYRLEGFENELKISGLWKNFVDAVVESPQLFGSNSTTFFGRSMSVSNLVASGQWGAYFNGTNSTIRVYGLGGLGLRTNTLVTITRQNWTNAQTVGTSSGSMMLSGLFNTNTGSGDYFVPEWNATLNGVWLMQERATNLWANSQSNLVMALRNGNAADYATLGVWGGNRSVFCMQHDGVGGQQFWYNGVAGKLNYYTPQTRYSALYTNVDDLNCLSIGYDITNAFVGNYGGFGGQVQAVLIFNTTITTAQAQSIQRITQWLDPATTVEFDIGDSRTAPTPWRFEWPYFEQLSEPNVCVYNIAWNGTKYNDLVNTATSSTNYLFPQAACVNQTIVKDAMGVNDIYANGANGPTINAYRTNLSTFCHALGFQYWPATLWDVGTNALSSNGGVYTWSATSSSNMYVANFLTVSNAFQYDAVPRLDWRIAPNTLNTNTQWSLYGLHYDGTNGFVENQIISAEMKIPSRTVTTNYGAVFVPFVLQ